MSSGFFKELQQQFHSKLAEIIIGVILLVIFTVVNLFLWRVSVVDPALAGFEQYITATQEQQERFLEQERKDVQRLEDDIEAVRLGLERDIRGVSERLSRIEGLLGRLIKGAP